MPNIVNTVSVQIGGPLGLITIPITFGTEFPWTPLAFHCKDMQSITVDAGTFSAYEIESTFFDLFEYFYAPEVGTFIKLDATMPYGDVIAELVSTNYN